MRQSRPATGIRVARLHDRVPGLAVQRRIRVLQELGRRRLRLHGRPVVDEVSNRDARRELRHAAEMIAVPMRRDQVVDLP